MSELAARVEAKVLEFKSALLAANTDILDRYPIEKFTLLIHDNPNIYGYKKVALKLTGISNNIVSEFGKGILPLYYKLGLASLVHESLSSMKRNQMPESAVRQYQNWIERVLKDMSNQDEGYYNLAKDEFLKDIAVCSLRMIPVGGAWTVELERVSKRSLIANGPAKYVDNLVFHFFKQGGLGPYYVIHTYDRYLPRFTPKEMEKAYLRIADMLRHHPKIKGIYRGSWFLDPEMDSISPQLSFLRQLPTENGARLFRIKTRVDDVQKAIFNSPERKKLYAERQYEPTCWGYVWPRDDVFEWAENARQNLD